MEIKHPSPFLPLPPVEVDPLESVVPQVIVHALGPGLCGALVAERMPAIHSVLFLLLAFGVESVADEGLEVLLLAALDHARDLLRALAVVVLHARTHMKDYWLRPVKEHLLTLFLSRQA